MTVSEIIEALRKMSQDQEVVAFWGDGEDMEFTIGEVGESLSGPTLYLNPKP